MIRLPYPYPADRFTLVGRVSRSHGLRGELKVTVRPGSADAFARFRRVALVATDGRMTELLAIDRWRRQGKQVVLKLDTIDSKDEADLTVAMGVLCPTADLGGDGPVDETEALIGLEVVTAAGELVGTVDEIIFTGAHPLLVVTRDRQETLIPLVERVVVERSRTRIVIDPPPGLLEINRK